jgi:hypothetical protein
MDQDRAVNKILRDLKQFELIKADDEGHIRLHLQRLYTAGWEEGNKRIFANFKKTIILYNKYNEPIAEYESAEEAARQTKCSVKGIYSAVYRKSVSRNGNYWKYKDNER